MRVAPALLNLGIVATLLSGCSFNACTTVGYPADLDIVLSEPTPGLELELCLGADCEPGDDDTLSTTGDSSAGWSASVVNAFDTARYWVTDQAGATVTEGELPVEWIRVGGSEQCGGPMEASLVIDLDEL